MELTHPMKIYKICDARLWKDAEQAGTFHGAGIDIEDGYIHFSTAAQLPDTARLHYHNRDGQLLVTVDATLLDITWEPSRGGDMFPHLYSALDLKHCIHVEALFLDENKVPTPIIGWPK